LRAELLSEFATQDANEFVPRLEEQVARTTASGVRVSSLAGDTP
jgi:hypothetical protein